MNLYESFINFKSSYLSTDNIKPEEYKSLKRHALVETFINQTPSMNILELVERDYDCFLHPLSLLSLTHRLPTVIKSQDLLKDYIETVENKLKNLFDNIITSIGHTHIIHQDANFLDSIKNYPCMVYVVCIERFNTALYVRYNVIDKESIKRLTS